MLSKEEIIDVLRPFAAIADTIKFGEDTSLVYASLGSCRAARDLLSRLDAEGETDLERNLDKSDRQLLEQALRHPPIDLPDTLNQEGGDAVDHGRPVDRPHVTPPASADQGSGRATGGELIEALLDAANGYEQSPPEEAGTAVRKQLKSKYLKAKQALLDHIVAMYAAGRLSGIEEAAEVAGAYDGAAERAIRSLITKETKP